VANVNKVILVGRLTRDPETRSFSTGGKVAKFGFAVNNRKKNSQTGQWEEVPVYVECEAFNRGDYGKLADTVEQYLRKGAQTYIEGHLHLDQWDDKQTGQKRSMLKVVVDVLQFLDSRPADGGGRGPSRASAPPDSYNESFGEPEPAPGGGGTGGANEDIPF